MAKLTWCNHRFECLAEKALHWRDADTLILADAHFGKAAAFRSAGIPVPAGTTLANLQRLDRALAASGATRLVIVGDFLHARSGRADLTMSLLGKWRAANRAIGIVLVRGNHDRHAGDPPNEWNIQCVDEPWMDGGLVFCHGPCEHDDGPVIAGHIHPSVTLHDVDGSTHRAACFLFRKRQAVLPGFGSFTGTHPVSLRRGDRVFVIGHDKVVEIPRRRKVR